VPEKATANRRGLRLQSTAFMQYLMTSFVLSIGMLGGFALLWGAWALWRRHGLGQKLWLMVAAAVVVFANVAIWTVPDSDGNSLAKSGVQ
jgi:hypothetical protein